MIKSIRHYDVSFQFSLDYYTSECKSSIGVCVCVCTHTVTYIYIYISGSGLKDNIRTHKKVSI